MEQKEKPKCSICGCTLEWDEEVKKFVCYGTKPYHSSTITPLWDYNSLAGTKTQEET